MGKVVGLNPIAGTKNGKKFDAVIISMVGPHDARDSQSVGQFAENEYVDRVVYDRDLGSVPADKLVGQELLVLRDRKGYVKGLRVEPAPK